MKNTAVKKSTRLGAQKLLDRGLGLSLHHTLTRGAWSVPHLEYSSSSFKATGQKLLSVSFP